jgi:hypothetical protein
MEDFFITQKLSNKDRYCIEICKAKCCYTLAGKKCPNLSNDFRCSIHHLWKDNWCHYQTDDIHTLPITYALQRGLIRKEIADQCCYAHPELLKVLDGTECNP